MRKSHKKYSRPAKPFDKPRIIEEDNLMKKYGLKNKKEIWKAEAIVKKMRNNAKALITEGIDKQKAFVQRLINKGFLYSGAHLDDALGLIKEKILDRRLQTIVYKKKFASTVKQARQFIVHGHVAIKGKKVTIPSYSVTMNEEMLVNTIGIKKIETEKKSDGKNNKTHVKMDKKDENEKEKQIKPTEKENGKK